MLDEMRVNDEQLKSSDLRQIENAEQLVKFFAKLRYDVDVRKTIPLHSTSYANTQNLKGLVTHHEYIATAPNDQDIRIYLFEVRSITAKLRNELARGFLNTNDAMVLLVLTVNYEDIEFVYLERTDPQKTKRKGLPLKPSIRPISLTVNRLNPDSLALRVLKRFTFTETDSDYQWEKLRSAYTLAEWSEQYFNNRALFSDYYLKNRLTDVQITPQWNEDVRLIGREVFKHLSNARANYSGKPEELINKNLFEPLFTQLGFNFTKPTTKDPEQQADYNLYAPTDQSTPIAAALTYAWNRNLDTVDESRDNDSPDEIPGALVVSLLEKQIAPWVIVTNGKLWRLYSSTASNKATNYYEVDLEEAIAASDQLTALKYWWLLFRREAFTGFLDQLLKNSADYAKELGARLKDRVFVDIFPQFAKGFIANQRAQGLSEAEIDLPTVFNGTMTFLYRLMFALYAESLELLPINEAQGYQAISLYRLKHEIANVAGTIQDQAPELLSTHYSANNTNLYAHLTELFEVIDKGSEQLNMPTYNGGLFSSQTESGKFLAQFAIPDQYLAQGLDKLARDIDTKTQALVFIDFKSLGVRQLGSIYEGLLEFKLKIASQSLAVTREKGKEIYLPANKVKKPITTLAIGDVYLENDKQERKATGSYYTPDYIVKYIVKHTIGPVLERKFAELRPRLHSAQKGYRDYTKLANARIKSTGKLEDITVYWNDPKMQQLVDDCLNIRVVDPAMGSAHFLVEAVDYISNRLIDFLNGWTENPVWNFIERTRQDILVDMARQKVNIDAERLTRVALLKRAVLKRCIYGVDMNLMAVELAKVSLWLDAFTLGAPLSFLDHHLKHGNSLIGARIADVQNYLNDQETMTLDMFSDSKFVGVMLATDLMRKVSYLSDNTVEQARQSALAYRDASDHLAPFKRILDVYTSRWFGNPIPKKGKPDNVRRFLQDPKTEDWSKDPTVSFKDSLISADLIAQTALQAAESKRFFHWELEFPEVFFAPSTPSSKDIQLDPNAGFDAVIGNPPWGGFLEGFEKYFEAAYPETSQQYKDIFKLFIEKSIKLIGRGFASYIVPNVMMLQPRYQDIRKYLLSYRIDSIINLGEGVFEDVEAPTCIFIVESGLEIDNTEVKAIELGHISTNILKSQALSNSLNVKLIPQTLYLSTFQNNFVTSVRFSNIQEILVDDIIDARDCGIKYQRAGVGLSRKGDSDMVERLFYEGMRENPNDHIYLKGSDVDRYYVNYEVQRFFRDNYDELLNPKEKESVYFNANYFNVPRKIIWRQTADRITACIDDTGIWVANTLQVAIPRNTIENYDLLTIVALLNSHYIYYLYDQVAKEKGRTFAQVKLSKVRQLPLPQIDFTTPISEREQLTNQIIAAYDLTDNAGVLTRVQTVLAAKQTDVVHDLLAHLAQQMIELNKTKQLELKRFLTWLETKLQIKPNKDGSTGIDALTGKSIIQGYLGDYQKGQVETTWDDFYYRLHQNRNRFNNSLNDLEGEIQIEYEKSLNTLLPIKQDLARTDTLIDKIVYRLYGLTDAEIELIERPQYEQALIEAKDQVVNDQQLSDEDKANQIAQNVLPVSQRFFDRIDPSEYETALTTELPNWRQLPPDAQTFLLTGEYNLRSLPDHMDFSTSAVSYAKIIELVLLKSVFEPFRQHHTDTDVTNDVFKAFMRGGRKLTLGNYPHIIPSSREPKLRQFMTPLFTNLQVVIDAFKDNAQIDLRNKAAHAEVLTKAEAQQIRAWVLNILKQLK